jgi:hypothetical protein
MNLASMLKSDSSKSKADAKLSTREQALINYAVFAALKNEDGMRRIREMAADVGLTAGLLEQADAAVKTARSADQQSMGLDEALAKAAESSCCKS